MKQSFLQLEATDNVLVALQDLGSGEIIEFGDQSIKLIHDIPAKHKFSIKSFEPGDPIMMYGVLVGKATQPIPKGGLISTQNIKHATSSYHLEKAGQSNWVAPDISKWESKSFDGYHRADGKVGTANYWLIIPLVFCENKNIESLKRIFSEKLGYAPVKEETLDIGPLIYAYQNGASTTELQATSVLASPRENLKNRVFPNVDGIKYLIHEGGCGGTPDDNQALCNLLAGYITHANVAGATVLGLGCQIAQESMLEQAVKRLDPAFSKPLIFLDQQKIGTEQELLSRAVKETFIGLVEANKFERKPAPLSKLILGLECGGSDGFSGLSANPALGYTSDLLVGLGGTTILGEFPELNGVEQELVNRCANEATAQKFSKLMKTYAERAAAVGVGFENNPSPGNIKDGLITDAIKSAGAAKKGGTSPVQGVLDYTEPAVQSGLNLLCTPGNDVESTTALAGSGANIMVFTTGLGTPTGNAVAPVIKMSTNTALFEKMPDIIDFDAGSIIRGEASIQSRGADLLDYIIEVASGREVPAAVKRGQDDFIPWKRGVSL